MPQTGYPDWTQQQGPGYAAASVNNIGNNTTVTIFTSSGVYRVWQIWLAGQFTAASTYAGGGQAGTPKVTSDLLGQLAALDLPVTSANDHSSDTIVIPMFGVQAGDGQAARAIKLTVPAPLANSFIDACAGIIYSVP